MPAEGKKGKKQTFANEDLYRDPLVARWMDLGFGEKEMIALQDQFKKIAKDRKLTKQEQKQGRAA